ncbi:MAG: 16S rRNA (cytosine(1402)-N(4))-methyltransferase, partial [Parcubacteria group bacterium RIFCSPHIGHO2_01_FULL_47_10b]
MSEIIHTPVLLQEVIDGLSVRARGRYIDATLGFGGHTRGILDTAKGTSVLGIERDPEVARQAKLALRSYGDRVKVVTSSYEQLSEVATATDEHTYDGIVFDLGYSSWHVDESGKGFSFRKDEPLDMRYNPKETSETAGDIINTWNEEELFHIFATFGEERTSASRRIARAIVQARKGGRNKIRTTGELVGIIE